MTSTTDYMTHETECSGEISIFAKPNTNYDPTDPESPSFTYVLREGTTHFYDSYVLVCTHEVTLQVPAGINLVSKAVETLRAKIKQKKADLAEDIQKLEDEIAKLALITYQPADELDLTEDSSL